MSNQTQESEIFAKHEDKLVTPSRHTLDTADFPVSSKASQKHKINTFVVSNVFLCSALGCTWTLSAGTNTHVPGGNQISEKDLNEADPSHRKMNIQTGNEGRMRQLQPYF